MSDIDTSLAWAAGYFDGEGCVTKVTKGKGLRITLVQCSHDGVPEDLLEFARIVGYPNKVYGPRKQHKSHHALRYDFDVSCNQAREVMEKLYPYLRGPKKRQFEEFRKANPPGRPRKS